MSIHKTASGTYRVRWREAYRMRSRNFKRKVDAVKFEAELRAGVVPSIVAAADQGSLTFIALAEKWLTIHAEVHKSPSSVGKDRQMLMQHLFPQIGLVSVGDLTLSDLVDLQRHLRTAAKLSAKSVNLVMGLCHKILEDAQRWGDIGRNVARGVRSLRIAQQDYRYWSIEERDRFLAYAMKEDHELYCIVAVAVNTGLRRGEVEALRWDCIDFSRRMITVKRNFCSRTRQLNEYTKGKSIRWIPMNKLVCDILFGLKNASNGEEAIFKVDFQNIVSRRFKPLQAEAGVGIITFHDLRHTFASHLAILGVNPLHIKQILGHAEIKTTMRYMHLAPDHLQV